MDADTVKILLFAIACVWSRQAQDVFALHVGNLLIVHLFLYSGAYYFQLVALLYCLAAASNIKFLSTIRWALFAVGALNWWASVDYLASDNATWFYHLYPVLVNCLDVLVLLLLWKGGASVIGKYVAMGHRCALSVLTCKMRHRDPKENIK